MMDLRLRSCISTTSHRNCTPARAEIHTILNMIFFAITDDRDERSTFETHCCKRRRSQNDCFNSQHNCSSPHEMNKKAKFLSGGSVKYPIPSNSDTNFAPAQLLADLPAFVERAKQLFRENNSQLHEELTVISDSCTISDTFLTKQAYFVNRAVMIYLQYFVPPSSYHKLSSMLSSIFVDSSTRTAEVADLDTEDNRTSTPFSSGNCSPTACTVDSLKQMSFDDDFDVFENVLDNSSSNYCPYDDLSFDQCDGINFFD